MRPEETKDKGDWRRLSSLIRSFVENKLEVNMTVKIRGGSFQVDFVQGGSRYRRQFQDRLSAEAWEINAKSRLIRGLGPDEETEVKDKGPTFRVVAEQVWELVWQHQSS